jgi:hypothetical protein
LVDPFTAISIIRQQHESLEQEIQECKRELRILGEIMDFIEVMTDEAVSPKDTGNDIDVPDRQAVRDKLLYQIRSMMD